MIRGFLVLALLSMGANGIWNFAAPAHSPSQASCAQDRDAWVMQTLAKMESIQPGMTRAQLLTVFTTEGGLSDGLHRTYVSRECGYFKVDVEFEPVGRPARDKDSRVTVVEDNRDVVVRISRPFLQASVAD